MVALTSGSGVAGMSFGQEHFGGCDFGDKRLTDRAVFTADAFLRHPGGTLPDKLGTGPLQRFYDFANNPRTSHAGILAAHMDRTRQKMVQCSGVVLVIHDTTEADYSGLDIADLGPIGNGGCRGLLLHNVLAVDWANREVLGLVGQFVHRRRTVSKKESAKAKREHPERESRLWLQGVEAVGQVPAGQRWVNLMDRGGDTFESLERQHLLGQSYEVRSKSNRVIEVRVNGRVRRKKLHSWARKLPMLGHRRVHVSANQNQVAREAKVRVAAGPVRLLAPHPKRGEHGNAPLETWVVHVREDDPPRGCEPLEWFLLSNVPAATSAAANERVDWYECRPMIEEFHKAQKTGCGMELLQFTTRKALETAIGVLSVVAMQLLRLRDLSRREDAATRPATDVVDEEYVQVLSLWRHKQARPDWSIHDFFYALARLGGHLNRRQDKLPGWLVLWRGWSDLQLLVEGARTARLRR